MTNTEQASDLQRQWGAKIRSLREGLGLSVTGLARKAELDKSHLWQAENGTAGLGDGPRMRIAAALGCRVEDIFTYPPVSTELGDAEED